MNCRKSDDRNRSTVRGFLLLMLLALLLSGCGKRMEQIGKDRDAGIEAMAAGDWETAEQSFRHAMSYYGTSKPDGVQLDILRYLGDAQMRAGKYEDALGTYRSLMEADGRKPVNIFTFGPALVIDGEGQDCKWEDSIHETHLPAARTAIGQLGPRKYFVMSVHGANAKQLGMSANDMVEYILKKFPECKYAYNLDGGNSSKMVWHGRLKSEPGGGRQAISGLIYFASAVTGENP